MSVPFSPVATVEVGREMHGLMSNLYPLCRSITGKGTRDTLYALQEYIPLALTEVPTGTRVLDWAVPNEWNVRDAYVKDAKGNRVVDFQESNLHLLQYSVPVRARVPLAELKEHLFTLPQHPDWIPYRTSYYHESWGFCLRHRQLADLADGEYEVHIESTHENGSLTYGECRIAGQLTDEILISCHICHPSLCNDNLSGIVVATFLARSLAALSLRYSYRFLFIPGTIGAISWLARNEEHVSRIKHGLVLACLGDSGHSTYKRSRRGSAEIDQAVIHVLRHSNSPYDVLDFSPYGYDERQFCSPGFDLPVGCMMRTPPGGFPEYHTSADDLSFVRPESLRDSLAKCLNILMVLEGNRRYLNRSPKGEPQLGRRGIYGHVGGQTAGRRRELALLWVLNLSDGKHSLLDIADRADLPFWEVKDAADLLVEKELLEEAVEGS